jgi:octaprenyl-diphosphate synthase
MNDFSIEAKNADIETIRALAREDMEAVDRLIQQQLHSDVVLINQISGYIINSGGKRLRPLVALLAAQSCGYRGDAHQKVAAIIEFIHTATLLHDDVVDVSEMRRGNETANAIWGNAASILVGDFLYSRAFQMMVSIGNMRLMEIMANTTNRIAEGEVLQLLNCNDPDTTEERYRDVIYNKTAKLFEAASCLGAVLTRSPAVQEQALAAYGIYLGTAFQLVDDVLDYSSSSETIGKNVGDDLAEGKPTLPLIYAMRRGSPEQRRLIRDAIEQGSREQLDEIIKAVESTGAIDYTKRLAQQEAERAIEALNPLPDSCYKEALTGLAEFSVSRTF